MQGAENARYYHTDHLVIPIPDNKQRRCMGEACTSIVKTKSLKCDVELCIACFAGSQKIKTSKEAQYIYDFAFLHQAKHYLLISKLPVSCVQNKFVLNEQIRVCSL